MALRSILGGLAALAMLTAPATLYAEPVDLELVIATDVSRSIDEEEAHLQRDGVAKAFLSRAVVQAIRTGMLGRIAVAYIDWSSAPYSRVVADWRVIHDETSAALFARDLMQAPLTFGRRTSISDAIGMAIDMLETNAFKGTRRTIDVSGDGPNNAGLLVTAARDKAVAKRIVINGLPIKNENDRFQGYSYLPDLDLYYEGCVIGGPGAFMVVARDFKDFAEAIKKKLILEIAGLPPSAFPIRRAATEPPLVPVQANPAARVYEKGCDIGERMRAGRWMDFDDQP